MAQGREEDEGRVLGHGQGFGEWNAPEGIELVVAAAASADVGLRPGCAHRDVPGKI